MITIVMSVYNEKISDLDKSINSVLNQTINSFEFIIICDNPDSAEIKNFLVSKSKDDSRIKIIFNNRNMGQNLSRNKAVKSASNNCISIMDADDIMDKRRLETQYSFFKANNLSICFSNVSIINDNDEITREKVFGNSDITNQKIIRKILYNHSIALGPTFMFDKNIFELLGGYTNMNVEDYELVSKFIVNRKRLGYIGKPLIYKRLRNDSISYNSLYEQYIIMRSISNELRKYNGEKLVSHEYVLNNVNNITNRQLASYMKYSETRYKFNDSRNWKIAIILVCRILLSTTVLFHLLWSIKNKIVDKYYDNK